VPHKGVLDRRARHRHGVDRAPASQNGVTASFTASSRDECLSLEWFPSRAEAKVIIEAWRRHNQVRPHSSLNYLTPNEFVARGARPAPRQATGGTLRYMGSSRPAPRRRAVRCGTAPRPVARPSRRDTCSRRRKPSQANRGPKNQGRSRFASSVTTFILWTEEKSRASASGWARVRNCNAGWSHQAS